MRCIEFKGYIGKAGYGLTHDKETKKTISAHRLAFKQAYGYLPQVVMHICDNPKCINPEHLKAGTQAENIKDCITKGRYNPGFKLTKEQIEEIKKDPRSSRVLGKIYGVNQKTICNYKKEVSGKGGHCGV